MTSDERRKALERWIGHTGNMTPRNEMADALYACSEVGIFNGLAIDNDLALKIWSVLERLRRNKFPEDLRM